MKKQSEMSGCAVVLVVAFILAVVLVLVFVWAGLAVGASQAWVMHRPFSEGWHAVFNHKWQALGWAVVFGSVLSLSASQSN